MTTGSVVDEQERTARAGLTALVEPGDDVMGRLLERVGPTEVVRLLRAGHTLPDVPDARVRGYQVRLDRFDPAADLAAIDGMGGRFVCPGDHEWPHQLDDLGSRAPVGLWVRGAPSLRLLALRSVAVVGARACTAYGNHVAGNLAADLADQGWAVVSGAAYGVDGAAHRGALAVGGATIAVIASGPDVTYPRGHAQLLQRIAEQGLLVGELPPGAHPTRTRFIQRNRLIAALATGTVVVEAARRSGALITARRAAAMGRFLMAVPGPVTSALSDGTHELLRDEAVLVTRAAEVVELCGRIGDLAPPRTSPLLPRDLLDAAAKQVLEALPARGGATTREVARGAGLGVDDALRKLHELVPLGFVKREGPRWSLVLRVTNDCADNPP